MKRLHGIKLFVVAIILTGITSTASAATIEASSGVYAASIAAFNPIGQSFVAEDPLLGFIAFAFQDMNPTLSNSPITMTLYNGAGFGGTIVNSVVQTLPSVLPGYSDPSQFIDFDFSGTSLTAGSIYTAAVSASSYKVAVAYNGLTDAYLSGRLFSGSSLNACDLGGCDLNFRVTPAAVPVPAAAVLFGTGVIGLVGVARRRARELQ